METSNEYPSHPIMQLRDDVLNFLEAIDAEPGSEINKAGFKFARTLKELHQLYMMEFTIEHMESCFNSPDYIKTINQRKKVDKERK